MFLPTSRYNKVDTVTTKAAGDRTVTALKLRPLAAPSGDAYTVKDNDQPDVLAQDQYADGTKFWHIADANTALRANDLVAETGATLIRPAT